MRVEYIEPFLEAATGLFQNMINIEVEPQELYLKANTRPSRGVAVLVGLAGVVDGRLLIDMSNETALKLVSHLNGETYTEFDDMARATLTELGNMTTADAVTRLDGLGFHFDLTPPILIRGTDVELSDSNMEALMVPLTSEFGNIDIMVAVKEKR